jgi:hypothetical protein
VAGEADALGALAGPRLTEKGEAHG